MILSIYHNSKKITAVRTPNHTDVKALGPDQLDRAVETMGQPRWRTRQILRWLYTKRVQSFSEMANLPAAFRAELDKSYGISQLIAVQIQHARDQTIKALLRLTSGRTIETVLIPDFDKSGKARRLTVCVSSQVGCAMGCTFCATGQMGFQENLNCGQIVDQVVMMNQLAARYFGRSITNVVYMGMGEPMLNFDSVVSSLKLLTHPDALDLSRHRITVSTVGIARRIRDFVQVEPRVNLAFSLHAPNDEKRASIMPVSRSEHARLAPLVEALQYYTKVTEKAVTFEYCMFSGFNDTERDARDLAHICNRVPSKVNLIMYNAIPGVELKRSSEVVLNRFMARLVKHGVTVTVRRSRGADIAAACGQLAAAAT